MHRGKPQFRGLASAACSFVKKLLRDPRAAGPAALQPAGHQDILPDRTSSQERSNTEHSACSLNRSERLGHCVPRNLMNVDHLTEPRMPRIKQFPTFGHMGFAMLSCTTRCDLTAPWLIVLRKSSFAIGRNRARPHCARLGRQTTRQLSAVHCSETCESKTFKAFRPALECEGRGREAAQGSDRPDAENPAITRESLHRCFGFGINR
jgi:hypothetical protein